MKRFAPALGALLAAQLAACGGEGAGGEGGGGAGGSGGAGGGAGAGPPSLPPSWDSPLDFEVPQGLGVKLSGDVSDPEGDPFTLKVLGPAGVEVTLDGNLVELHAGFVSSGPIALELELKDANGATSYPVLPANIKRLGWLDHLAFLDGPSAREHAAVLYDEAAQRAFVVEGSGYAPQGTPLGDVWAYQESGAPSPWSLVTPTGDGLPPAGSRRAAGSLSAGMALLFGGQGAGLAPLAELYRVEPDGAGLKFTALAQVGPPPARSLHVFAHDPTSGRYVAFGGLGAAGPLGDTWLLEVVGDVATWTEVPAPTHPSARYGAFQGLDLVTGRLLVWGGAQGVASLDAADDTWALDLRATPPSWALLGVPGGPPGRHDGCAVLDYRGPNLWVFGGTADGLTAEPGLWVLDGRPGHEAWHQLALQGEPPERSGGFGFFDGSRVFFGYGADATPYRDWEILGHKP